MRISELHRQTEETEVNLRLNLDGSGQHQIDTGVGFFDHLLRHVAFQGCFNLELKVQGDLEVDPHHTIEDTALVLGQAIDQALDDRSGINRMGFAYVPMDDALARVVIDLSGRPYSIFKVGWHDSRIGQMPTSLIEHVFRSLATSARANLHADLLSCQDDHHGAEALFKALGRSLRSAVQVDPNREGVPSTKGVLR
jgi:imidazoleglycerol-phosphate dehydratase